MSNRFRADRNVRNKLSTNAKSETRTGNKLKCISLNARSIVNKFIELELCIDMEQPDILGITETWLDNRITDSELSFEGYTLIRRDREDSVK